MVIYEVNLKIDSDIFNAYYTWLVPHVKNMLHHQGFNTAMIQKDESDKNALTITYRIDTRDHLEDYLQHHSQTMRNDGVKRFPGKFTATRRIFTVLDSYGRIAI